jgi:GT2 family glycosyltransferase
MTTTAGSDTTLPASAIIASRNRQRMLRDTVDSLLRMQRPPRQIVVVDQSDEADEHLRTLGETRGCEVVYIHSRTTGLSRARNIALRAAGEEAVWIIDDDMLVEDGALERLVESRAGAERPVVTTGRLLAAPPEQPGLIQPPGALVTRSTPDVYTGRQPIQVVPGPNVLLPRELLLAIGGYDERLGPGTRFPAGEDHDLSLRLLDAGCEVRHVPDAVVLHRSWRSRRDAAALRFGYARGEGAFYAKHMHLRDRHTLGRAMRQLRRRLAKAARSLFGSPVTTAAELVSAAGLVWGALEWTLRHRLLERRS